MDSADHDRSPGIAEIRRKVRRQLKAKERRELTRRKDLETWEKRLALARCGRAQEQFWVGVMYKSGSTPATKDIVAAYKWVSLAARAGYDPAVEVKRLYATSMWHMNSQEVAEIERSVAGWNPEQCKAEVKGAAAKPS